MTSKRAGLPDRSVENNHNQYCSNIPISHVSIPDRDFLPDPADVARLAQSIQSHGLQSPIVVSKAKGRYQLVEGLRRFIAVRDVLGYTEISCHIRTDVSDSPGSILLRLSENLLKRRHSPMELASWLGELKQKTGWANKRIALELGFSESWVSKKLSLLEAPSSVREAIVNGKLAETQYYNDRKGVEATLQRKGAADLAKPSYVTCKLSSPTAEIIGRLIQQALGDENPPNGLGSGNITALIQRYADTIADNICVGAKSCEYRRALCENDTKER